MTTHPENTLPAFHAAIDAAAHMIEFDVTLTKDNELVVKNPLVLNEINLSFDFKDVAEQAAM